MQVYRGPHGGAQVKNGYYGNKELFHAGVKVGCFFGKGFIKFGVKLTSGPERVARGRPFEQLIHVQEPEPPQGPDPLMPEPFSYTSREAARQQVAKAEADRVQAELSFLKAQINPHFSVQYPE